MKRYFILLVLVLPLLIRCEKDKEKEEEINFDYSLVDLVNEYREGKGLDAIPVSKSLMKVALMHVEDLDANYEFGTNACSLHSWSDKGNWSSCCYTTDHAEKECMWDKPRELTTYTGNGYEIAAYASDEITIQQALNVWAASEEHKNVLENLGVWHVDWKAVGAARKGNYAVVWFGNEEDTIE